MGGSVAQAGTPLFIFSGDLGNSLQTTVLNALFSPLYDRDSL